jgi:hypothetical protein
MNPIRRRDLYIYIALSALVPVWLTTTQARLLPLPEKSKNPVDVGGILTRSSTRNHGGKWRKEMGDRSGRAPNR